LAAAPSILEPPLSTIQLFVAKPFDAEPSIIVTSSPTAGELGNVIVTGLATVSTTI